MILGVFGATNTMAAELTNTEKAIVEKSVKAGLKDPDSARFKWLPIADGQAKGNSDVYCGVVNSRNSFGGYAGDAPYSVFLVRAKESPVFSAAVLISIGTADWESPASFAIVTTCKDKGYTNLFLAK